MEGLSDVEQENARLKEELAILKAKLALHESLNQSASASEDSRQNQADATEQTQFSYNHSLSKEQIIRYSRHLLLPSFGLEAQKNLCNGSVLIIGCGGLGSPAALYLAAAGVGRIGLVDHDMVDVSNLHRQIIHTSAWVGLPKVRSAAAACRALNPLVQVEQYGDGFNPKNALAIVEKYDVVLDATDNPTSRYLINDACVVAGRPLVSAAAVGTDGQLTVYNKGNAPCYRCVFPESPAPENCSRCSDAGVLGVVPGVLGTLQALEAIKILGAVGDPLAGKLLLVDALAGRFTTVKLRRRAAGCAVCGEAAVITRASLPLYDYVKFTGQAANDGPPKPLEVLTAAERLTPVEAWRVMTEHRKEDAVAAATATAATASPNVAQEEAVEASVAPVEGNVQEKEKENNGSRKAPQPRLPVVILDVRPESQVRLLDLRRKLDEADVDYRYVSVPYMTMAAKPAVLEEVLEACRLGKTKRKEGGGGLDEPPGIAGVIPGSRREAVDDGEGTTEKEVPSSNRPELLVLCRRGNHSQLAVRLLQRHGIDWARDIVGGIAAWAEEIHPDLPVL